MLLVAATSRGAGAASPAVMNPYTEECGSCHIAYPVKLMPRSDWSRVLGQLDRHFGVDASLDAATVQGVAKQLGVTAPVVVARDQSAPLPRISTQPWFKQEHREVSAARFRAPAVKSASNCSACHAGAERGIFEGTGETEKEGHDHD
jgi:mono/diheme cytochrome c family protein